MQQQEFTQFKSYLFEKAGITEMQFQQLLPVIASRNFAKGTFILNKGDICRHTFFVESGLLRSYSIDEGGKEHIIQFAPENWFISDRGSVYFNEPSDFFVQVIEDSTVVFIEKGFISLATSISDGFIAFNEKALHNHIRHMQKRIDLLLGATAETRYLSFVKMYPDLTMRVPQWMIASYLGITPESLSRVRKELARVNYHPRSS